MRLSLHQRLTLDAAANSPFPWAQTMVRLADVAREQVLTANGAEPYDHRIYKFWERTLEMYLHRLFGEELGLFVLEHVYESGEKPSWVIRYYSKGDR